MILFILSTIFNLVQSYYVTSESWINPNNTITVVQNFCILNSSLFLNCTTQTLLDADNSIIKNYIY